MKLAFEVVDKRKKEGWLFGPSFFLTIKCIDERYQSGPKVSEISVTSEQYYTYNIGNQLTVTMYQHSNGRYYPRPQ